MSEILNILTQVVDARAPTFADTVKLQRTGATFLAEIEPITDIEANVLLGRDARESVQFHVASRPAAAALLLNDVIEALGEQFKVLRRSDNPGQVMVTFGAMKLVEDKDEA